MDAVALGSIIAVVLTIAIVIFLGFKVNSLMKNSHSQD